MSEDAAAGIKPACSAEVIVVEGGVGGHVDGRRVVVVAVACREGAAFACPVRQQWVDLARLRLEVQHLGPQEAAIIRTRRLLLLGVPVVAGSAGLLFPGSLV